MKPELSIIKNSVFPSWTYLNLPDNPVKNSIISDWQNLLSSKNKEQVYHTYLSDHAGFFFHEIIQDTLLISKLKFGADFISDFVVCYDRGSDGFHYELIELERPDIPLYTKQNKPTAHFFHAIQQILDWKAWLISHSGSINNIFPSSKHEFDSFLNLKFTIIISNNKINTEYEIKQRNLLSKQIGISIRSYDYLTDKINKVLFSDTLSFGNEPYYITDQQRHQFGNPFFTAYSDHQWRKIITSKRFNSGHMVASNISTLLEYRSYNQNRVKQFEIFYLKQ